ncbi:MAG: hypothetical protein AABY22_31140, partial [Nanoarchaeota archaeon]
YQIGGKNFLCPKRTDGSECPICDFGATVWKKFEETKNEAYKENWKKFAPKKDVYAPIVVRGEEEKGIRLWRINQGTYKALLTKISNNMEYGVDILDPLNGKDVIVPVIKQTTGRFTFVGPDINAIDLAPVSSPLLKDIEKIKGYLDVCPNIKDIFKVKPVSEMKKALDEFINPESENSDLPFDEGTTKDFKKDKSIDDQFDEIVNNEENQ